MEKLKHSIIDFLQTRPPAESLFNELNNAGDLFLIGGVLREYLDNDAINSLRDIDIVIKINDTNVWNNIIKKYNPSKNIFCGYKFICSEFIFDVWLIEETWAFKNNLVHYNNCDEFIENLQHTVFLNMDALVYDFKKGIWYKDKYDKAIKENTIDVVLKDNPQIPLNIVRLFVIKNRYNMKISNTLKDIIIETLNQYESLEDFIDQLIKIQNNRYHNIYLDKNRLKQEITNIVG